MSRGKNIKSAVCRKQRNKMFKFYAVGRDVLKENNEIL